MQNSDIIEKQIEAAMDDMRVAIPGKVIAVNDTTIDVQPQIKLQTADGPESMAPMLAVPVIQPAAGGYKINFPIKVGDTVMVVYQDRAIDAWDTTDAEGEQVEYRAHHPSDAVAIVGLASSTAGQTKTISEGLEITGVDTSIILYPDGKAEIKAKTMHLESSEAMTIKAKTLDITADMTTIDGKLTVTEEAIIDSVNIAEHKHDGVRTGTSKTKKPDTV